MLRHYARPLAVIDVVTVSTFRKVEESLLTVFTENRGKWLPGLLALAIFLLLGGFDSPRQQARSQYEDQGSIVWEVPMNEKWIALTFDDGPHPTVTPLILDLLKQYDAKATFFVIGYHLDKYPHIVERELQEGHEVGNHTDLHTIFNAQSSEMAIAEEIRTFQHKMLDQFGQAGVWFRPPGGYYNDRIVRIAQQLGYTVVLWSWHQDTKDWKKPGVDYIVHKVLDNARNGDIILFHDHVNDSMQTVRALETILPALQERGFRMVTVSQLIAHGKPLE